MAVRKTKPVWLFSTPGHCVVYESKADLDADMALVQSIAGAVPEATVQELLMILDSGTKPIVQSRKRVEYSSEFEAFWLGYEPKKNKAKMYQEWLTNRDAPAA